MRCRRSMYRFFKFVKLYNVLYSARYPDGITSLRIVASRDSFSHTDRIPEENSARLSIEASRMCRARKALHSPYLLLSCTPWGGNMKRLQI
jgi:hypothetical protein